MSDAGPGLNRAIINARYKNGQLIFPQDLDYDVSDPSKVSFRMSGLPFELEKELSKQGIEMIPPLIDKVTVDPSVEQTEEFFLDQAFQHNAFEILKYLQRGGNPLYLPKTPFMPDISQIREYLQKE